MKLHDNFDHWSISHLYRSAWTRKNTWHERSSVYKPTTKNYLHLDWINLKTAGKYSVHKCLWNKETLTLLITFSVHMCAFHSREMSCLLILNTPFWASYEQEQIQRMYDLQCVKNIQFILLDKENQWWVKKGTVQ